jgi:hypothetical protein
MVTERARVLAEYNELKCELARRDMLREIAAAALADHMGQVVERLVRLGVLPKGTEALRDSLLRE